MPSGKAVDWVLTHGLNILIVLAGAAIVVRGARILIGKLQKSLGDGSPDRDLEWQRRATTLGGILTRLVTAIVWFVVVLVLLRELGIDVLPILTGAGIAGLAIGFGAQNLVRDVISGFFLILEDQVRVGDVARINGGGGGTSASGGATGVIEQVSLRTIVLRDAEGAVHVFPNGTVTSLANLSKSFANALVDVKVPYFEPIERVFEAIRRAGASMEDDPVWAPLLLAPIEIQGVESIADGGATIRAKFKTQPLSPGRVANELRRRLLTTFAGEGLELYSAPVPSTQRRPST